MPRDPARGPWLALVLALALIGHARAQQPAAGSGAPGGGPGRSSAESNLGVPGGLREGTGGRPTEAQRDDQSQQGSPGGGDESGAQGEGRDQDEEREKKEDKPPPFEGPGWLNQLLGLDEGPVHAYGWIQNSFTGNTNGTPPSGLNFGLFPNRKANQWMGNQYYLVFERTMSNTDKPDFGWRVDSLFGNDWQFTKAYGFFDNAFRANTFHGFDLPQAFGEVHLPILTEGGFDAKFGRWYSIAGYESVMATKRPLLSWPYVFTFFPFTFSGLMTTWHATDRLNVFNGAAPGVDRWFNRHLHWTYIGGLGWTSKDGKTTATLVVMNGPNQLPRFLTGDTTFGTFAPTAVTPPPFLAGRRNLGYADNYRTYTQDVVTHKWTDKLTQAVEFDYAFDDNTPGAGPGGTNSNTTWYGAANWFLYQLTDTLTGVWRTEVFHDGSPFVTGQSDTYYEFTLGAQYKPYKWLWVRPEARYDWAQYHTPFNDGTRGSRLTLGFDVIVLF